MIFVSVCQNITTLPLNSWGMIYSFLSKPKYELFAIWTQPCSSVKQKACCPNLDFIAPKYKERPIPHTGCISCPLWLFSLAMIIMWGLRTFRPETFFIYTFICETSFFFIHLRYTRISLFLWAWFGKFGLRGFISWHYSQPSAHHLSLNKWSERLRDGFPRKKCILLDFVQNDCQILNFEFLSN